MTRPLAVVSVDVDPVDLHLVGYGYTGLPPDPLAYTTSLPRLMAAFARHGIRATGFVVGRDAAAHAEALRAWAAAGHEVASHSMSHPMPLAGLSPDLLRGELETSRDALAAAVGEEIVGFRAPNWDVSPRVLEALAAAGYRYDASIFPSWLLVPARALLALKARDPAAVLAMRPWPMALDRKPGVRRTAAGPIAFFPVSVTPGLRFPIYHTARYLIDERRFLGHLDGLVARGEPLFYPLHAVDALGLREDQVDRRLAPHPGMERSLQDKLAMLAASLAAISERFESVTYREFLRRTPALG
jgi:peptidoglycan/xylan/chitin deacetylase (PgdA/CDA1 family)